MPTKTYNVATAAKMVGVSASTIRGWCATFADRLSDTANPASGTERRLNDNDVAIMQMVKQLREDGRAVPDIAAHQHSAHERAASPTTLQPHRGRRRQYRCSS